jgi:hypothetical protein
MQEFKFLFQGLRIDIYCFLTFLYSPHLPQHPSRNIKDRSICNKKNMLTKPAKLL